MIDASVQRLLVEERLLTHLRSHSKYFFGNRVSLRVLTHIKDPIGGLCGAHIIGPMDILLSWCTLFNGYFLSEPVRKFDDRAHALIIIPLTIWKGKVVDLKNFILSHTVLQQLKENSYDTSNIQLHESHLI